MSEKKIHTEVVDIDDLIQDDHNFNKGTDEGAELIGRSFKEHGAGRSVFIDKNNRLVGGNKAQIGFKGAGYRKVVIVDSDPDTLVAVRRKDVDLDTKQGREMALLDNLTTQVNLQWDAAELGGVNVEGFDAKEWGLDPLSVGGHEASEDDEIERKRREFDEKMKAGEITDDDPEYQDFVQKFELKKTTDDCYTPDIVYNAVAEWVATEYNVSRANFVRPFYPGGDYQKENYKPTDIVVDNPPFSILASILDWYNEHGIRYFLFGPHLVLFCSTYNRCASISVGVTITYANGANISTSFATNMEPEDVAFRSDSRLYKMVDGANRENIKYIRKQLPKYVYPSCVITTPTLSTYSRLGIDFVAKKSEVCSVAELDAQREEGKSIFGRGFLLCDRLTKERERCDELRAEREAKLRAEREAKLRAEAHEWQLSQREHDIIEQLNRNQME